MTTGSGLLSLKKIGIIGAGQMGNVITQVAAAAGFEVVMFDIMPASLDKGLGTISGSCDRLVKKAAMTEDQKKSLLAKIVTTTKMTDLANCDFVVEAATENIDLKLKIFKELDEVVKNNHS